MCQGDVDCSGVNQVCDYGTSFTDHYRHYTSVGTCTCAPGAIDVDGVCIGKAYFNPSVFCGVMFAYLLRRTSVEG